jgi:hypothetical protein
MNPPPTGAIGIGMKVNVADMDRDGRNDLVCAGKSRLFVSYNKETMPSPRTPSLLPPEETYPDWVHWTKWDAVPKQLGGRAGARKRQ